MKQQKQTYTLIEILAVIVIIGILASLTLGVSRYVSNRNAEIRTVATIKQLEMALEECKVKFGFYPEESFGKLQKKSFTTERTSEYETLFRKACEIDKMRTIGSDYILLDGWGREMFYESDGKSFVIYSAGADGVVGSSGKALTAGNLEKDDFDNEDADDLGTF